MEAGLGVPREPAEIRMDQVRTASGRDLTSPYEEAAKKAYSLCQYLGIRIAILKEKSPACGVHEIHNGRFDGGLVKGMGVTARYLKSKGIEVYSERELPSFLAERKERAEKREAFLARQARYLEGQGQNEIKPFRSTHNKENDRADSPREERDRRPETPREERPNYRDFSRDERRRRDDRPQQGRDGKKPYGDRKPHAGKKPYGPKPGKFQGKPRRDGFAPRKKDEGGSSRD